MSNPPKPDPLMDLTRLANAKMHHKTILAATQDFTKHFFRNGKVEAVDVSLGAQSEFKFHLILDPEVTLPSIEQCRVNAELYTLALECNAQRIHSRPSYIKVMFDEKRDAANAFPHFSIVRKDGAAFEAVDLANEVRGLKEVFTEVEDVMRKRINSQRTRVSHWKIPPSGNGRGKA